MKFTGSWDIRNFVADHIHSLGDLRGKRFIDIPAGVGYMANIIRETGADVAAYDIFPSFFEAEGIECKYADLSTDLPIPAATADYVLCQEGIEHIPNQLKMLQEFNRILKPGGTLLLTTPNASNLRCRFSHLLLESDIYHRFPANEFDAVWFAEQSQTEMYFGHIFLLGIQKLRILAKIAGFQIHCLHPVRVSNSALLLGITFYPLIRLANLFAFKASMKRPSSHSVEMRRQNYEEIARLNLDPNVLFGKHLFVEFRKACELDEVRQWFPNREI